MDQSTFNHGNTGDTNPKGRSRSPLLELYTRSLRNEREEKIGHRTSAACGGRLRLCYTLDEGKESERETTNCPPKRVRSTFNVEVLYLPRELPRLPAHWPRRGARGLRRSLVDGECRRSGRTRRSHGGRLSGVRPVLSRNQPRQCRPTTRPRLGGLRGALALALVLSIPESF